MTEAEQRPEPFRIYVNPVKYVSSDDPAYEEARIAVQADPMLRRRIWFHRDGSHAILRGKVLRERRYAIESPIAVHVNSLWMANIDIEGDPERVEIIAYDQNRVRIEARPYFPVHGGNPFFTRDGRQVRKTSYRLRLGCKITALNDRGELIRFRPHVWPDPVVGDRWSSGYEVITDADRLDRMLDAYFGEEDESETDEAELGRHEMTPPQPVAGGATAG